MKKTFRPRPEIEKQLTELVKILNENWKAIPPEERFKRRDGTGKMPWSENEALELCIAVTLGRAKACVNFQKPS